MVKILKPVFTLSTRGRQLPVFLSFYRILYSAASKGDYQYEKRWAHLASNYFRILFSRPRMRSHVNSIRTGYVNSIIIHKQHRQRSPVNYFWLFSPITPVKTTHVNSTLTIILTESQTFSINVISHPPSLPQLIIVTTVSKPARPKADDDHTDQEIARICLQKWVSELFNFHGRNYCWKTICWMFGIKMPAVLDFLHLTNVLWMLLGNTLHKKCFLSSFPQRKGGGLTRAMPERKHLREVFP